MTKFVFKASAWEDAEYVVTVRPDWEKGWKSVPLGPTVSKRDAEIISRWLHFSEANLRTLFRNELGDEIKNSLEFKKLNQELDKLRKEIYG